MKKKFNIWMALFAALALVFAVGCKSNGAGDDDNSSGSTGGSTTRYVGSADELIAWAEKVNSGDYDLNCTLTGDIDMDGKTWTPVGAYDTNYNYTGTFDGNGHTISNLTVSTDNNAAFIAYLGSGGTVTGLGLENVNMSGYNRVGGVVGGNFGGTIASCWTSGTVTGRYSFDITSGRIGGITGQNRYGGIVIACYSTATVTGNHSDGSVGGIAGANGFSSETDDNRIIGCYFAGSVSNTYSPAGAIVGENCSNATANASYWSGNVDGVGSSSGTVSVTKIADNDWLAAMNAMNSAIGSSTDWHYKVNTGSDSATVPLLLVQN